MSFARIVLALPTEALYVWHDAVPDIDRGGDYPAFIWAPERCFAGMKVYDSSSSLVGSIESTDADSVRFVIWEESNANAAHYRMSQIAYVTNIVRYVRGYVFSAARLRLGGV